jgi:FkbM family methyltransferase
MPGARSGRRRSRPSVLTDFEEAVAIEPDPDVLVLLRTNPELNGVVDRVTVVDAAVAGTEGEAAFRPGTRTKHVHCWMKGQLVSEPSPETVPVRTVTLDGLVGEGVVDPAATGLLWFDCAGHEAEALRTAESFRLRLDADDQAGRGAAGAPDP